MIGERKNNPVSAKGLNVLRQLVNQIEEREEEVMADIGEAGGRSQWHDNPAFDEVRRSASVLRARRKNLGDKLRNAQVISPRTETNQVGIGNAVIIRGDGTEQKLNLLGSIDALVGDGRCISFESPLGQALLGKKQGEIIRYQVDDEIMEVKLLGIEPGDF
jgi:transcription elongation factor GreA